MSYSSVRVSQIARENFTKLPPLLIQQLTQTIAVYTYIVGVECTLCCEYDYKNLILHAQVLYIVQLPNEEGDMHIIYIALGTSIVSACTVHVYTCTYKHVHE